MSSFSFRHQTRTLRHTFGSIDCLSQVRAAVDLIRHQEDHADLLVALKVIAARLGADAAYYVSIFRPEHAPASYRYLFACDPPWIQAYDALDAKSDDPWIRYALRHPAPARACDIAITSEREQAVVELADRCGFRSAAVVPLSLVSSKNRSGVLVVGSAVGGYFDDDEFTTSMIMARSMAMEFHERNTVVERREWLRATRMTSLDLMLLSHAWEGRSTKAMAAMTGVNAWAIDKRFFRINARLGTPNRRASARLAAEHGAL